MLNLDGPLTASVIGQAWQNVHATSGVLQGRAYFEVTVDALKTETGLVRVGWTSDAWLVGSIADEKYRQLGMSSQSFAFGGAGFKSTGKAFEEFGQPFSSGDVVGVLQDIDEKETFAFSVNGKVYDHAFQHIRRAKPLFPALALRNAQATVNFGATPWRYPPPEGFVGLDALPARALAAFPHDEDRGGGDGGDGDDDRGGGGGGDGGGGDGGAGGAAAAPRDDDERGSIAGLSTVSRQTGASGDFWERRSLSELRPQWRERPQCPLGAKCQKKDCRDRHPLPPGEPAAGPGEGGAASPRGGGGGGGGGRPPLGQRRGS